MFIKMYCLYRQPPFNIYGYISHFVKTKSDILFQEIAFATVVSKIAANLSKPQS